MATPPRRQLPERRYQRLMRWLGGPDSWRRIIVTGAFAGIVVAFAGAMIAGLVNGGDLDGDSPRSTPEAPVSGPIDASDVPEEPVIDTPVPVDEIPTEVPTEIVEEPTVEDVPTEAPVEPSPTVPVEVPTEAPTVEGG